ncbi:sensor histidine kinase [Chitinophaga skermanii]|nr:histidine kinase [Chitinophaga skermanii]
MQESVNSIFFIAFAAITSYFLAYIILPRLLHKGKTVQTVVIMVLGLYVINVFSRISVVYLLEPLIRTRPFEQESIWEIVTDIDYLFMVYFVHAFSYAFIFVFIKLLKDQYVINKRALNLEKQKADIELMALKSQLNPHFLFNTLNNIYSLSIMQSPQTSPAIARLSEILDTLLYRSSNLFVPISQEIQLLNNYIELEKLRYDDRLEISLDIQVERDVHIAPLILLSLVENSFKHGAGEDAGSPKIHIQLLLQNHLLSFVVSNTFQSKVDQQIGIGLDNISKQLNLLYPETHTFETVVAQQTFTAKLNLVLNNNT